MVKKIKLLIFFMLAGLFAMADNVEFVMEGPDMVSMGEQFRLGFTLNDRGTDLQLPDLSNFDVLMGPSTSQSSSIQIINGKTTQSQSFSYIFVLRAKKEGKFTIRPASIKVGGKTYESNSLNIQVVKGQPQQQAGGGQQQGGAQQQDDTPTGNVSKDNLFVRVAVDKSSVSKGEQILATVKLYISQNVPLNGFDDVKLPSYEGFWTKDIEVPTQVNFTREVYNGRIYQVGVLKKTILFPQQVGNIRIDPFEISCLIRQRVRQQQSFFDDFFDNYRVVKAKVVSDPVIINVRELPNQPDGFTGAVGNFSFTGALDKTDGKTNEAMTLKLNISGNGNLNLINPPKIELPQDFESYEPKTTDRTNASENGMSGSISFEYLFIPRYAGNFTIPAVKFVYFNPGTRQFETKTTEAFNIHIEKGKDDGKSSVVSSYSKEDVKMIGKDIRFIKQNKTVLKQKGSSFYGTFEFYLVYILSALAFAAFFVFNRKKIKENENIVLVKNKQANKVALKRLKEASVFLKNNQAEKFYEAVIKALWGYLSDKLSIPVADLNREKASAALLEKGISPEIVAELMKVIDDCEFARYAPAAFSGTMNEIYDSAAKLMGIFEKLIK
ncbi:MAG TPA: BatD family protein [Prolixibacteraceae bacterium]|nr:BatD family protein [Prolixibacteraceae bacterium]HPR85096.1 BatD family protein [Prolixibacteraceae bacterium]